MGNQLFENDIGTEILINMGTDVSDATTHDIQVKKPSGSTTTWSASVYNSNYLRYIIQSGDLDETGIWELQPYFVFTSWQGHGTLVKFEVLANLI